MSAIMNGLALHGGFIPYGGTFLVFSDYARNAIRMSALMGVGVIYIYTHDSIGLGEDGPTHQPIEHAASLRLIPRLSVWRPCDGAETAACDDDCTAPLCQDGNFNLAAGEACDDGAESAACDDDCTVPVCQDGNFNAASGEACDDGAETAAGDGDCTLPLF